MDVFILAWIAVVVASTLIGVSKGRGLAGFLWGFFLGIIGLIVVVFLESVHTCKFCKGNMAAGATVCSHCSREQ